MDKKILFIGGGNMAKAIITGLLKHGYNPKNIYVVDHNLAKRQFYAKQLQLKVGDNITDFVEGIDIIILAIKPQSAEKASLELHNILGQNLPIIISVMAGITTDTLASWLGNNLAIIRAMPNTPALIQEGVTGLFANSITTAKQKTIVEAILSSIGIFAWLTHEEQINAVTALFGSGPAYYFYFIEIMSEIAIRLGIPEQVARDFAIQTAYGAGKLALESNIPVEQLRSQVTSKNGTTDAAICSMQESDLSSLFNKAIAAAHKRSIELSQPNIYKP